MKTYLDCIPCFLKQALFAARAATDDEERIKVVLDRICKLIPEIPLHASPPETGREIYRIVREATGVSDPFAALKAKSVEIALARYPGLIERVARAEDPLEMAVRLAIAGNVMDFGANPNFELEKELRQILSVDPTINHYQTFREMLGHADHILYLGDNAGETVFDRILIEVMGKSVVYVVRDRPVINDATALDAVRSGLDHVATIISSGWDGPGVLVDRCSEAFLDHFHTADLIISKGQGNYETLSTEQKPIFFLLKVKCPVIARDLGVKEGRTVIQYARHGTIR